MNISSFGWSYVGRRSNNQDSIIDTVINKKESVYFFAVADGMGGTAGGEIASKTVIDTCKNYLSDYFVSNSKPFKIKQALRNAIEKAEIKLKEIIENNKELSDMGTTLTCVLIVGDKYVVGNIGDSRTYLMNYNNITQLSVDHSYIQEYKNKYGGEVDEDVLKKYGHFVTRSLSGSHDEPDVFPKAKNYFTLTSGTAFLLCSDGLLVNKRDKKTEEIIHEVCLGTKNAQAAVKYLVKLAYDSGSSDNISVLFIEVGKYKRKKRISLPNSFIDTRIHKKREPKYKKVIRFARYVFILLIFLGLLFLGYRIIPWKESVKPKSSQLLTENEKQTTTQKDTEQENATQTAETVEKLIVGEVSVGTGVLRKSSTITWISTGGKDVKYTVVITSTSNSDAEFTKEIYDTEIELSEFKNLKIGEEYKIQIMAESKDVNNQKAISVQKRFEIK